jgi:hypothetical protein
MACFDFFLRLESPEIYLSAADNDIVSDFIIAEGSENIFWSVEESICDDLETIVASVVPNSDNFIRSQTYEMESILVDV